jgi:hypothetical protein
VKPLLPIPVPPKTLKRQRKKKNNLKYFATLSKMINNLKQYFLNINYNICRNTNTVKNTRPKET